MKFIDNSFPNWLPNACFCAAGLCSLRPRSAQMSLLGCRPSCSSPVCNQSRQQIARSKSPVQNWSQLKTDLSETCSCSNFARLSWKCFVWKMSRRRTHGIVAVAPCDKKHRKAKLQTCASWWRTPSIRRCSFFEIQLLCSHKSSSMILWMFKKKWSRYMLKGKLSISSAQPFNGRNPFSLQLDPLPVSKASSSYTKFFKKTSPLLQGSLSFFHKPLFSPGCLFSIQFFHLTSFQFLVYRKTKLLKEIQHSPIARVLVFKSSKK